MSATTAADIASAILELPGDGADGAKQIADFIAAFCRAKKIDPQAPDIQVVYQATAEYKAAKQAEERQAALGRAFTKIEAITKTYRANVDQGAMPTTEQIDAETDRLKKAIADLGAVGAQRRIYTAADYMCECLNFDPSKDFTPALFGGLAFPDGTTSYIGARTSRGKTTVMVNLAREALDGNRKTIFITLEMSGKQIMNKLILSAAFAMGTAADDCNNRRSLMAMNPNRDIYAVWKRKNNPEAGTEVFHGLVTATYEKIKNAQEEGRFILYDGRGASEEEIINYMTAQGEKGAVILLDYIQKMPSKAGTDTDSFRRVQAISYDVVNTAAASNAVIIAGAQFNRTGGTDGLGDMFDDQSFREAGDIEQDAHNAIGIGWRPDKKDRFYEILKTREDNKQGEIYLLDFSDVYSFMAKGERSFRPENGKKKTSSGKWENSYVAEHEPLYGDKPKTSRSIKPL
ncbi:MAG: hypothetical protein LBH73_08015 [Spirochaetaceae bacterium]|nr:hypothetical protein [Spirochaetaceae bacterium]